MCTHSPLFLRDQQRTAVDVNAAEKYLDPIAKASEDWQVQVKVLIRNKADGNAANFKTLFSKFVEESREAVREPPFWNAVPSEIVFNVFFARRIPGIQLWDL